MTNDDASEQSTNDDEREQSTNDDNDGGASTLCSTVLDQRACRRMRGCWWNARWRVCVHGTANEVARFDAQFDAEALVDDDYVEAPASTAVPRRTTNAAARVPPPLIAAVALVGATVTL